MWTSPESFTEAIDMRICWCWGGTTSRESDEGRSKSTGHATARMSRFPCESRRIYGENRSGAVFFPGGLRREATGVRRFPQTGGAERMALPTMMPEVQH